jgi:NAD(P)-dependent dehydrogenase (short-subunit alcohol dehydrogenase family)
MKTYLVTGATSGIGKIAAMAIAKDSPQNQVIFNSRNLQKGQAVLQEIIQASGNPNVHCFEGDFASLQSVKNFANQVSQQFPKIDVLLNNAGTWEMEFKESQDGIELNFAVNHLAPFLLTNLLLPNLKKSPSARIINTASGAHRRNILQFDDLEFRKGEYNGFFSYSQSKLCNLLFSLQLQKEFQKQSITNITVNTLHPGVVKTALFDKMNPEEKSFFGNAATLEEGSKTSIYLSLSPEVEGVTGKYWHGYSEAEMSDMAKNPELAAKLWEISMNYVAKFLD